MRDWNQTNGGEGSAQWDEYPKVDQNKHDEITEVKITESWKGFEEGAKDALQSVKAGKATGRNWIIKTR